MYANRVFGTAEVCPVYRGVPCHGVQGKAFHCMLKVMREGGGD